MLWEMNDAYAILCIFCTFVLFSKKPKCKKLQQNIPPRTETVSNLSKCEQKVQTGRYLVDWWVGRGRVKRPWSLLKRNKLGWSFTPKDLEKPVGKGGGGSRGMVFAPMQTGAETGSENAGGRSDRQFLPTDTRPSLPQHLRLEAFSEAGQPRPDGDSRSPRVCAECKGVAR